MKVVFYNLRRFVPVDCLAGKFARVMPATRVRGIIREEIAKTHKANVGQIARELMELQDRTEKRLKLETQPK